MKKTCAFSALLAAAALLPCTATAGDVGQTTLGNGVSVSAGVGYSYAVLDRTQFGVKTDWFVTDVISRNTEHDGQFSGLRLDTAIDGLFARQTEHGRLSFGVKGFYAGYDSTQNSRCVYNSGVSDCVFVPLYDPSTAFGHVDVSGGYFSDWHTRTSREVTHWGVAAEMTLTRAGTYQGGSIKDEPVIVDEPVVWRFGPAFKKLKQKTDLFSEDFGPIVDPVTLNETVDTNYFGAFVGVNTAFALGRGFSLIAGGEVGAYYAQTKYRGRYSATATLGGLDGTSHPSLGGGAVVQQWMTLENDMPALIGGFNAELRKDIGFGFLGFYGQADWYSHIATVKHNTMDRAGGGVFDLSGSQDGTQLGSTTGFFYTVGAKLTVPMK